MTPVANLRAWEWWVILSLTLIVFAALAVSLDACAKGDPLWLAEVFLAAQLWFWTEGFARRAVRAAVARAEAQEAEVEAIKERVHDRLNGD